MATADKGGLPEGVCDTGNNGRRTLPTIVIGGATALAEPSDPELAAAR